MENVILVIHLILAFGLICIVLLQRSEGGGLGIGGGGGAATGRPAATAMTKLTWAFAAAFLTTSVALTVIAAQSSATSSVVDLLPVEADSDTPLIPALPEADALLPPAGDDATVTPPRAD